MSAKDTVAGRLETNTAFLKDLIADIQKGVIKIPQFQRKFVWRERQALDLLDSIASNYPVGSLLLWRTPTKLAVERNIGDFKLPTTDDLTPTDYVLDGQQRITVVYSCLGAPVEEAGFAAGYDLEKQEFVQLPGEAKPTVFPMRLLFHTTKLLNFRTGLQTLAAAEDYQKRLDGLINAFITYKLPVVILKELSVEEVCPIFERINSAGTKLSMFDLMVAATWSTKFDFNDLAEKVAASLEAKGFDRIEHATILKCAAAIQLNGFKKNQLLKLRDLTAEQMQGVMKDTEASLQRAVDLLFKEFDVFSLDFLPYEAVLIILCYVCARVPKLDHNHVLRIRQWFWRSAFSERYRVGGENFVTNDLADVLKFVSDGINPGNFGAPLTEQQILSTAFRSNNSRSRATILALACTKPRNLTNGAFIDPADALSQFNKKQFHHIYPQAYLRLIGDKNDSNCLANICMLAASENNLISDTDPHVYLSKLIDTHGADAKTIFASNLMPDPGIFDYKTADYKSFLEARAKILASKMTTLCAG